jgi:glyoxylase-like metal-dependent hydrolase (beta-lactamase superfamily II)
MMEANKAPAGKGNDALRFPFKTAPVSGAFTDVAPGVKWLRMPLPFALDHINLWVLDDGDGWTVVDTGADSCNTRDLWQALLAKPLASKPLKRVICTHYHPDHMGLAGWLADTYGVPVWATPKEIEIAREHYAYSDVDFSDLIRVLFVRAGLSAELVAGVTPERHAYKHLVASLPAAFSAIDPACTINAGGATWSVVIGEGHSPQLAALYAAAPRVLIAGDQVLPGITPNVGVIDPGDDSNPLKLFLDSLARFRQLPADTFVLPSHKLPFYGLHERIDQIVVHHQERLRRARIVCASGASAGEVLPVIFERMFQGPQLHFALVETLAHLNYLIGTGEIVRETTSAGVDRYRTISAPAEAA